MLYHNVESTSNKCCMCRSGGKNYIPHFGRGVNPKLAYFTHTCVGGFVATPPLYSDVYVHHYVYIGGVQPSADTSFSALTEYRR